MEQHELEEIEILEAETIASAKSSESKLLVVVNHVKEIECPSLGLFIQHAVAILIFVSALMVDYKGKKVTQLKKQGYLTFFLSFTLNQIGCVTLFAFHISYR